MASAKKKRSADNYLTDQNWDQEETESANDNEVKRSFSISLLLNITYDPTLKLSCNHHQDLDG